MTSPVDHFIATLDQIIESPRWKDEDTPMPGRIDELAVRINDGKTYQKYRRTKEYELVIEVIESFEDALNDDWMPFQIEGLDLKKAKDFATGVRNILIQKEPESYQDEIIALHKRTKEK
ncbi:hypothetical protein [Pelagicoccus albus]|uniref:Uncharacterized protein n=1 Tax=Pelagicoccus albus TaxID=415222 RepID=A0A7X1B614_9BACT|nr:hypothetical protein [Pelagicoccus albus]MBC2606323.1 hypothetical protein [Pelagicoccus albus]